MKSEKKVHSCFQNNILGIMPNANELKIKVLPIESYPEAILKLL